LQRTRSSSFALDQFHRVKALAAFFVDSELVNGCDVRMSQSGCGARLAQETLARGRGVRRAIHADDLQRNAALQHRVDRAIGHAHRAAA
jgi:hypothetical protein